jgi:hypothetical protein
VSMRTPYVFATFLVGGTVFSWLIFLATEQLFLFAQNPPISPDDVIPMGLFGSFVLSCVYILPAQAFVSVLAGIFFSFFKRVPIWFVLLMMIPICGSMVTYRSVSDRHGALQREDVRTLLYWLLVVTPSELLCARIVATRFAFAPSQGPQVGKYS